MLEEKKEEDVELAAIGMLKREEQKMRICSRDFWPRLAIKTKIIPWRTLIQMWPLL